MNKQGFVLKGTFIWSGAPDELFIKEDAFGVCGADGICRGVFEKLPEEYAAWPLRDLGEALIVPGYSDLHLHAAQYRNVGLGMDMTLLDWLQALAYPEEGRFRDPDYAREVYTEFVAELRRGFTTRAAIFASAHREGTEVLMELLEQSGLITCVGKVNMNRNAPDYIREPDETALSDTEQWLSETVGRYVRTTPILTPRFVPSCSGNVLAGLGVLKKKWGLPAQSHLDETPEEVDWVRELFPGNAHYADIYDRAGLLGADVLMAHCVYLTEAECRRMKETGTYIVHCPCSNANVRSGIAPIRKYLDMGMNIALGSDISGGHSLDMADTLREALSVSRLLWRLGEEKLPHLTAREVFYLATAGGGAYFGKVGRFEPGYAFDAVAVDDSARRSPGDDSNARFQKLIYRSRSEEVIAKYVSGVILF